MVFLELPVACADLPVTDSIHNLGLVGHIEDIVVNKDQQGKKLGLRIIEALDYIAEKVGCYKVSLLSPRGRSDGPWFDCMRSIAVSSLPGHNFSPPPAISTPLSNTPLPHPFPPRLPLFTPRLHSHSRTPMFNHSNTVSVLPS